MYGADLVDWLYKSRSGKFLSYFFCKAPLSLLYGYLQDTKFSKSKINEFVKNYQINLATFLPEVGREESDPYSSFNQFFIRKFKPNLRHFPENNFEMGAFAEARYYGFNSIKDEEKIPVKGTFLAAKELIHKSEWSHFFHEGPLLLARLCPVDYHRFHFPDNCKVLDDFRIPGLYHSVNPVAIKEKNDIFITNERHVTILETENFGKLAYIEVGAICVGKIIQSQRLDRETNFLRGTEKGYFLFGGSTVIVLGEKGKWKPTDLVIENTNNGMETYFELGTKVATKG